MIIPSDFESDISKSIKTLKENGCEHIYLFGSVAVGTADVNSDIDIAITGLPASRFFEVYSKASLGLHHNLDLVDLDHDPEFYRFLLENNRLVKLS